MGKADDELWMLRCVELARRGRGQVSPNPLVGCVIVDAKGRVVGEGWHRRLGGPHAEVEALRRAGARARGATLYTNLEPCNHHGRTPPCAPAVLAAGIRRVVIGIDDPIRGHAGGGRWLARRRLRVTRGVLADECAELNRVFLHHARTGRPWFTLKAGVTADGRVATRGGESRWITGPQARREVHELRAEVDAVLVGIGTVLADDPQLTVRGVRGRDPVRIVVDSELRTPPRARLLPKRARGSGARVIIATTAGASPARQRRLEAAGAEVWRVGRSRVDLRALAHRLGEAAIASVLVEGGAEIHAAFVRADFADELRLYVAPMVFGGTAPAWCAGAGVAHITDAPRFAFLEPRSLGDDVLLLARRT